MQVGPLGICAAIDVCVLEYGPGMRGASRPFRLERGGDKTVFVRPTTWQYAGRIDRLASNDCFALWTCAVFPAADASKPLAAKQ